MQSIIPASNHCEHGNTTTAATTAGVFALDLSAMDDVTAPDDELSGIVMGKIITTKNTHHQQRHHKSNDDDECRIPSPPSELSFSVSPPHVQYINRDFAPWKRDIASMTDMLVLKTNKQFHNAVPVPQVTDDMMKTTCSSIRYNERKQNTNKLIQHQQQLHRIKSDTAILSHDDDSSVTTSYSSGILEGHNRSSTVKRSTMDNKVVAIANRKSKPEESCFVANLSSNTNSKSFINTTRNCPLAELKLGKEEGKNYDIAIEQRRYSTASRTMVSSTIVSSSLLSTALSIPLTNTNELAALVLESAASILQTFPSVLSQLIISSSTRRSDNQTNVNKLTSIMHELADLKAPTTGTATTTAKTTTTTKIVNNSKPKSLIFSRVYTKHTIPWSSPTKQKSIETSIPSLLAKTKHNKHTAIAAIRKGQIERKQHNNRKKCVQFTDPVITDIRFRPKTPREEVNALFFQEEELLDWEYDEETTVPDRYEIVLGEIHDDISFHNSYS